MNNKQPNHIILTTPMCQEILNLAGVSNYKLMNEQNYANADYAFVLSETRIPENSSAQFIKLKLNTFAQIVQSIKIVRETLNIRNRSVKLNKQLKKLVNENIHINKRRNENRKLKIKVYSNFLQEILEDMGFQIVIGSNYDYLVYPDYLKNEIINEINFAGKRAIALPSHKKAPLNPIKRAEIRYHIFEKKLCMKTYPNGIILSKKL